MKQRGVVAGVSGPAQPSSSQNSCQNSCTYSSIPPTESSRCTPSSVTNSSLSRLFGDVHQLEGDVVARDQLAQAGEHVGIEDVIVDGRLTPLEHAEQGADVGIGHDPVTRHGAPPSWRAPPRYDSRAGSDIRVSAYARRPSGQTSHSSSPTCGASSSHEHFTEHPPSPTLVVAASATGLVAALLSLSPGSAHAIPDPIDVPPSCTAPPTPAQARRSTVSSGAASSRHPGGTTPSTAPCPAATPTSPDQARPIRDTRTVMVGRDDVRTAAERIAGRVRRTPLVRVSDSDAVWLKCEFLQHCGVFKTRGAYNRQLAGLESGEIGDAGIVVASGGNAGLAQAFVARDLGVRATVFVPQTAPQVKVDRIAAYGADVRRVGSEYAEAYRQPSPSARRLGPPSPTPTTSSRSRQGRGPSPRRSWRTSPPSTPSSWQSVVAACTQGSPPPPRAGLASWRSNRSAAPR